MEVVNVDAVLQKKPYMYLNGRDRFYSVPHWPQLDRASELNGPGVKCSFFFFVGRIFLDDVVKTASSRAISRLSRLTIILKDSLEIRGLCKTAEAVRSGMGGRQRQSYVAGRLWSGTAILYIYSTQRVEIKPQPIASSQLHHSPAETTSSIVEMYVL